SVQGPRIRRESVHHVPSVIGLNPTLSSFQIPGRNNQHARHVRKAYGPPGLDSTAGDTQRHQDFGRIKLNNVPFLGKFFVDLSFTLVFSAQTQCVYKYASEVDLYFLF
ncbi:unnamed protein product, partial [Allacma fusca]